MATIQVILKEKISNLGAEADVVHVRRGFARNFLLPQGKALEATKSNLRHVETLKRARAERETRELADAEKTAGKIRRLKLKLTLETGQAGKAFGSITQMDIHKAIEEQAEVTIDRHAVKLDKPIKSAGKYDVPVKIHADIQAVVKLTVTAAGQGDESEAEASE